MQVCPGTGLYSGWIAAIGSSTISNLQAMIVAMLAFILYSMQYY